MTASLDDVLKRVAAGELSPEEALRLIEPEQPDPEQHEQVRPPGAGPGAPGDVLHEPGGTTTGPGTPFARGEETPAYGTPEGITGAPSTAFGTAGSPGVEPVRSVRLLATYRQVTVVGDASVAQVHVRGTHTIRQEGDVLVVDGGDPEEPRRQDGDRGSWFSFVPLPKSLSWATGGGLTDDPLVVRVNPDLPLDLDVTGASLRMSGLENGARLRLLASSLKVDRIRGPLELQAHTSSVKGSLGPSGRSRIVAEQSSVKVWLLPGSDLELSGTSRMSKVVFPGKVDRTGGTIGERLHARLGAGTGTLTVEAMMSSVVIGGDRDGG